MGMERHEPADTRSMGIVHSALRRDLERTRLVLVSESPPDERRRRELADHIVWMMRALHLHHTAEDAGLWPLIRARNPSASALLDEMATDHRRIAPAITALEEAARAYRVDAGARERLLGALAGLNEVLLPHLRREELEMMPVVGATLTTAEYLAVENEYFVKPKGIVELGAEGPWIVDGATPEDRDVILHVIPAVPRFVLMQTFGRRYRRKAARLWSDGPAAAVRPLKVSPGRDDVASVEPSPLRDGTGRIGSRNLAD
ncbi:hemerythrin domain-containing protein [Rhodococcus sp. HM1]|nr:hemerythrin domain-containing protein [Rhodococcus sp. HM1]